MVQLPSARAMKLRPIAIAVLGALVLAGCGGSEGGGAAAGDEGAATVLPASAAGYVSINADLGSDQWEQGKKLAEKFPGKDKAIDALLKELGEEGLDWERDIDPALGPEVAVVVLMQGDEARPVLVTQPDDEAKLKALAAKADEPAVTRKIGDWWAVAEKEADLDLYEQASDDGALSDDDTFQTATADLPDEAIATFYVAGDAVQRALERESDGNPLGENVRFRWAAGALEALGEGVKVSGKLRIEGLEGLGQSYTPELLDRVPSRSLLVLSFKNISQAIEQLRSTPIAQEAVPQVEQTLGVTLAELGELFRKEGVIYVRQGAPIPEITVALGVDNEAKALATVDKLAARVAPLVEGKSGTAEVDGIDTHYLDVQGVRITYATFDGLLFVTSGPNGLAEFRGGGEKLADDDAYNGAKEAAGMGDETSGFAYVNLRDAIGLIQGFAGIAGQSVPPDVSANLAPLDTLLVHSSRDGDEIDFTGFLGIR